jgi:hypothetical protein
VLKNRFASGRASRQARYRACSRSGGLPFPPCMGCAGITGFPTFCLLSTFWVKVRLTIRGSCGWRSPGCRFRSRRHRAATLLSPWYLSRSGFPVSDLTDTWLLRAFLTTRNAITSSHINMIVYHHMSPSLSLTAFDEFLELARLAELEPPLGPGRPDIIGTEFLPAFGFDIGILLVPLPSNIVIRK